MLRHLLLALSQMIHRLPDVTGADGAALGAVVGQHVDIVGAEPGLLSGDVVGVAEPVRARQTPASLLRLLDVGHRAVAKPCRKDPLATGEEDCVPPPDETEQSQRNLAQGDSKGTLLPTLWVWTVECPDLKVDVLPAHRGRNAFQHSKKAGTNLRQSEAATEK